MKCRQSTLYLFLILTFFAVFPISSHAVARILDDESKPIVVKENACAAYMGDAFLDATLSSATTTAGAGESVLVDVVFTNSQPFPITDAGVFIEVVRDDNEKNIVDQFFPLEHIDIPAAGKEKEGVHTAQFAWAISENFSAGTYRLYPHVVLSRVMGNISERNDIKAATVTINAPRLDDPLHTTEVKVRSGGKPAQKDESSEFYSVLDTAKVSTTITNKEAKDIEVQVKWTVYKNTVWRSEDIISTKEEVIPLKKGEKKTISYESVKGDNHIEYIVGEISSQGAKTFLRVPLVWSAVPGFRLEAFGIDTHAPLEGSSGSLFACFRSTYPLENNTALTLSMLDEEGNTLSERTTVIEPSHTISTVLLPFFLIKDYALLHAKLSVKESERVLPGPVMLHLGCQLWDNGCRGEGVLENTDKSSPVKSVPISLLVLGSIVLIFASAFYFIGHKKKLHDLYPHAHNQ